MALAEADRTVRFHLSLNVADLNRSVAFYRALLGVEPAKCRPDYAKFEPAEPPLVLSLEPSPSKPGGALNHAGLRLPDSAGLVEVQRRLESAGIATQREEGVECCYARQTKFWVRDPDGTLWEVYNLLGDIDHRGDGQSAAVVQGAPTLPAAAPADPGRVWAHRLGGPLEVAGLEDGSLDEARLQGSFNSPVPPVERAALLAGLFRALRPGGTVFLHNLVGDRPLEGPPELSGPASVVTAVPTFDEVVGAFRDAGFAEPTLEHYDQQPCFVRHGVEMRQLKLRAAKPAVPAAGA